VQIVLAVFVVLLSSLYAIPKFASYSEVWTQVKTMTPFEMLLLLIATALHLVTYWWQNMVSIPDLSLWKAAVNNQTVDLGGEHDAGRRVRRHRHQLRDVPGLGGMRARTWACPSP
jgi:hypothetical protein